MTNAPTIVNGRAYFTNDLTDGKWYYRLLASATGADLRALREVHEQGSIELVYGGLDADE